MMKGSPGKKISPLSRISTPLPGRGVRVGTTGVCVGTPVGVTVTAGVAVGVGVGSAVYVGGTVGVGVGVALGYGDPVLVGEGVGGTAIQSAYSDHTASVSAPEISVSGKEPNGHAIRNPTPGTEQVTDGISLFSETCHPSR